MQKPHKVQTVPFLFLVIVQWGIKILDMFVCSCTITVYLERH